MDKMALLDRINQGERLKYLCFWGHTPKQEGAVDKSCFSQWYEASFELDQVHYATAEHYMMEQKARLFGDEAIATQILAAQHPGEAKTLGRKVQGFRNEVWQQHRFEIVVRGNLAKFGQNHQLREYLVGTGDRILVEASPRDRIWGIGLSANNPDATNPYRWRGENLLGFALMRVRQELLNTEFSNENIQEGGA